MSCFIICDSNYMDDTIANAITFSSENASYPKENTYADVRRGRVWRSAGYWNITALNNQIVFRDDAVTNITASIAVGEYSSISTFLAAIDTALEAVGVANYTVTQDTTTGKIKFTSDLSGGATAFQLITTSVNFTAASILGYSTGYNRTGAATYTADLLVIHQEEIITVDMGISTNVQACILIGKRNSPIQLSPTATITLEGNWFDVWTSPMYSSTLEYHDEAIYKYSVDGFGANRYWRIKISDQSNVDGYIELSKIFLGEVWVADRGSPQFGLQNELIDTSVTVLTEGGVALTDMRPQRQSIAFSFEFLTKQDAERVEDIFTLFGTGRPFFILLDDNEAFSTENQRWCKMVKFENEPSIVLNSPNNFSCTMKLREEL